MFEKILVPLDGSELAEVALPYAEELRRRLNSDLVLICISDSADKPERREYLDSIEEMIKQRAQKYQEKCPEKIIAEPQPETVVIGGHPSDEIVDYAEENQIDLTIMATHGRSGFSRWAMGSVADKVARGLSKPVCLIRAKGCQTEVRPDCLVSRIFTPLDGSKTGEAALPYVEVLAKEMGTEVLLFQTVPKDDSHEDVNWGELRHQADRDAKIYLRKVEANLIYKGVVAKTEVVFGDKPAQQIIELAERSQSAVVAMSTHGRSGVDRLVFGSVAEKVLRAGTVPLLLVRAPGSEAPRDAQDGAHCKVSLNN
ncbi:MAG: universal stress protein [Chloroflexi bacterium]|nr:universal stress protein [Chloroflexota bacterium]